MREKKYFRGRFWDRLGLLQPVQARLRSAWLGRLGLTQIGVARPSSARLGSGLARPRCDLDGLGLARFGLARLGSARRGLAQASLAQIGSDRLGLRGSEDFGIFVSPLFPDGWWEAKSMKFHRKKKAFSESSGLWLGRGKGTLAGSFLRLSEAVSAWPGLARLSCARPGSDGFSSV